MRLLIGGSVGTLACYQACGHARSRRNALAKGCRQAECQDSHQSNRSKLRGFDNLEPLRSTPA